MNNEMLSVEEAQHLIVSTVSVLGTETVPLLDAVGRVCAKDVISDMDIAPFAHSAMDGFALRSSEIEKASPQTPITLRVISEIGAGDVFSGKIGEGECVRIMTGAELPGDADTVVKYEIVENTEGDGHTGSIVSFSSPSPVGANIRQAGEEAHAGEAVMRKGEVVSEAGIGFLAGAGALEIETYIRPRIAIMATGSELVPPTEKPGPGHIRESNSYAMAACAASAGAHADILPIVEDTFEALSDAVSKACEEYDFVVTTGGAANGDYDYIKKVIESLGELRMSTVNMRPGKAQAFGLVSGTPVFGLPGNPAAAYCGFQMLIRPGLLKMQGYSNYEPMHIRAVLTTDVPKKDPRRIYLRSTFVEDADGRFEVTPSKNQSSGLFSVLQRSNCLAVLPEGTEGKKTGDIVDCILLGDFR